MIRPSHVRWFLLLAVVAALAAAVPTAGAARRPRSALDEGEREGREPEVEVVVLRFVHIPAESFVDTLEQLAEHPEIREGMEQMPLAVNEPANAVILIAPPEVADAMRRMADELDQPNEFHAHQREREAEEAAFVAEMEERERHLDREQEEFDLEMDRRRLDLERGTRPRPRGGVCAPDCRCPWRGTPRCRDAGPPCPPGCRCPRCPMPGKPPCPDRPWPGKPCPKMGPPPASGRPCPPPSPAHDKDKARHEHRRRIEDEQRKVKEMFDRNRREAEAHLEDLERKRHHLKEEHRRRMEEHGDRLTPDQREAHERALHEHIRDLDRAQEEARHRIEEAHRHLEEHLRDLERKKHEMMKEPRREKPRPDAPRRQEPDRPARPGRIGPGRIGPGLGRLLTPDGREALGLSDEQVEEITNLVRRLRRHMAETFKGIRDKLHRAGPEDRQHLLREMREKMAGRWAEHRRNVMDRLAEILTPDQRERLKDWLRERGPAKRPGRNGFGPPGPPRKPHPGRGKGPYHPSALERPAGCRWL
jgi:hypothetical protein